MVEQIFFKVTKSLDNVNFFGNKFILICQIIYKPLLHYFHLLMFVSLHIPVPFNEYFNFIAANVLWFLTSKSYRIPLE